ncbi:MULTISPECIES: LysR substrate-binding domain-containing protein [Pseudomonas]|uniref:LysR family transcriptional regulator n=1 Tax=Pseudomonas putida TaxID=303 RepID=A0A6S5TZU3_PSEPU|nr:MULTISPECIES: LysR substrate-binding domain-containing protein [Pseudomonas]AVH38213.1 LysR family transcriptional regulator [Pseudomonas monteilii]MBH3377741.1 LysR family transcriptional regulator [Pseudomonas asiatica]MBR7519424.1 LysR family transcriptional regulator [Pseudomonas juntendi]BBT42254.1 LysR family transcriptional regulator [Pseudomonas putida]
MDNLPPLRALQVFDTVGRCGGIAEAAKRLGISAGAVSQQMKLLEDTLGISLMVKEGKRNRLTSVGKRFHQSCADAFESLRIAQAEVELSRNTSNLRISTLPSLMSKWLAPLVFDWQDAHPAVDIHLDGSHAEPSANGYEIDFRITYSDRALDAENAIELFRDCVVPICSPGLLRCDASRLTPSALLDYPLLSIDWLPKFASPPSWQEWFKANDVKYDRLHDAHRVFSLSAMAIQAAIDGQGFVLAQYSMVAKDLEAGRLLMPLARPLPLPASYYLTWTRSAFDKEHCRKFHRWMVARGREQSDSIAALLAGNSATKD